MTDAKSQHQTKHIHIIHYYMKELVEKKEISVK